MTVGKAATLKTLGADQNNLPLDGGQSAAGDVITQKMIPDATNPAIGSQQVSVAAAPSPVSSVTTGLKIAPTITAAQVSATLPCNALSILNDDGASPIANTDVIWIGFNAGFTIPNVVGDAVPLRPGASMDIPIDNANKVYCLSATANQVLRFMKI